MSDLFRELLQSPLDDPPARSSRRVGGAVAVGSLGLLAVLAFVWLRGGDDGGPSTTAALATTVAVTGESAATTTTAVVLAEVPAPGIFAEMAVLADGTAVLFGGFGGEGTVRVDRPETLLYDSGNGSWTAVLPDPSPSPRFGHAFAFHPPTGTVVLFGGGTNHPAGCRLVRFCPGPTDRELWVFDPATRSWVDRTPDDPSDDTWPAARYGARFAFDPASGDLIMFGGVSITNRNPTFFGDTWSLDVETATWTRRTSEPSPPGRAFGGMVAVGDRILLFGGDGEAGFDDPRMWAYDPAADTWAELEERGPTARWMSLTAVDPQTGRLVLAGGEGNVFRQISESVSARAIGALSEVWTWSPSEGWLAGNPLDEPAFPAIGGPDLANERLLLFDGHGFFAYDGSLDRWLPLAAG